ncbi:MAG TPA: exodeoxyribonuclease III, partial [Polyangiaceae bacterium]|nr:exodeoxyribonuclease III [Polyangiaceae bacterium]
MRIATWNVNSLKARFEKVTWWLERAAPDVLLMQETKLTDDNAPREEFARLGYELAHHGQGRWNGVAIASKVGIRDVSVSFGEPLAPPTTHDTKDDEPLAEARIIGATCGGFRVVSIYAPNGRSVASPHYEAKLAWFGRLVRFLAARPETRETLVLGGDFNIAPADSDVWDPALCNGGTHVSAPERARYEEVLASGLIDAY